MRIAALTFYPGVIESAVKPPVGFDGFCDRRFDVNPLGDVTPGKECLSAEILHHLQCSVAPFFDHISQYQFGALARENTRRGLPDSRARSGDKRHFAVQNS